MIVSIKNLLLLYMIQTLNYLALSFTLFNFNQPSRNVWSKAAFAVTDTDNMKRIVLDGKEINNEISPMNNIILIKNVPAVDKTESGLILTGEAKIVENKGVVISTGPGKINLETGFHYPMTIHEGDGVLYEKYCETTIIYNGKRHALIRDEDVLVSFSSGKKHTLKHAQVLSDNVLVRLHISRNSLGALFLTQSKDKLKCSIGEVVKVGPGAWSSNGLLMEMNVSVGDRVKYHDFSGKKVEIDGDDNYIVLRTKDLIFKF